MNVLEFDWSRVPPGLVEQDLVEIFISQSLAIAQANLDLVLWSLCALEFLDDVPRLEDRQRRLILGTYPSTLEFVEAWLSGRERVPIRFQTHDPLALCPPLMRADAWGSVGSGIDIWPQYASEWHARFYQTWLAAGTPERRSCVLTLHAALLVFGEGLHYAGNDIPHDKDVVPDCDVTSATWNVFLALMSRRYPCLASDGNCNDLLDPASMVGAQGPHYPAPYYRNSLVTCD